MTIRSPGPYINAGGTTTGYTQVPTQRATTAVVHSGAGEIVTNVTITTVGNLANAAEEMLGCTTSANVVFSCTLRLTSVTNLEITSRSGGAATINVSWEVIYSSAISAQRGNIAKVHAGAGEETTNTTITDIGDITYAHANYCGGEFSLNDKASASNALTSSTNMRTKTFAGQAGTVTTNWVAWKRTA